MTRLKCVYFDKIAFTLGKPLITEAIGLRIKYLTGNSAAIV